MVIASYKIRITKSELLSKLSTLVPLQRSVYKYIFHINFYVPIRVQPESTSNTILEMDFVKISSNAPMFL